MAVPPESSFHLPLPAVPDKHSFQRALRVGSLGLVVALLVPALALLGLSLLLLRSAEWVDHTDQVIAQAHRAEKDLADMGSGLRGYQVTGGDNFLQSFTEASERFDADLEKFAGLVADNPMQSEGVARLREETSAWRSYARSILTLPQAQAASPSGVLRGKSLLDATRQRIDSLIHEEERLRGQRDRTLKKVVTAFFTLFGLATLGGIPLLIWWLRRGLRKTGEAYETSLRNAEMQAEELRVSLRSIGDAVLATDHTGKVAFLNPEAERLTGWTDAEARGQEMTVVLPIFNEHTGAPAENPVVRVLREHIVVGLANHTVLRARNGREIPIEDSAAPIFNADGSVRGVILVFHDVTEKKARGQALREAEWLARTAVEIAGAATFWWDSNSDQVVGDAALARFFRVPEDLCKAGRLPLARYLAAIHPDDIERVRRVIGQAVEAKAPYRCEYRLLDEASGVRWVDARGRLEPALNGRPSRLVGFVLDVTASKAAEVELLAARLRAEDALRDAADGAERFRVLAETVSLQVWTALPDGRLDWANHYVSNYFGVTDLEHEVLGTAWTARVHPDDLPAAAAKWSHALATGERYETEFRLRNAEGQDRWFLVRAEAMRDETGTVVKWFGSNTEIHDLKTAQQNAEVASRAKDNFLASLSHELRTPLTPALMTAANLREDERLPADVRADLSIIERNIALEARLIDDLLDLTRISRGKLQLREEICDMHSLIGLAADIVRDEAQSKPVALILQLAAERVSLNGDPARLQQVVWNLLRNAIKFTPGGGQITIRSQDLPDGHLGIEISDTGVGIAPGALESIFHPFEQVSQEVEHRFGGLGLGLAIARAIVDMHGGSVRAESEGLGRGATFILHLPGATRGLPGIFPATVDAGFLPHLAEPSLRVLLVEDHEPTLAVLSRLLTRSGHRVVSAGSIAEAVAAAKTSPFDLLVSDLGLPDGTGIEGIAKLRAVQPGLRGIALSGYGMEDDLQRSSQAGFSLHLTKPVDYEQLRRALRAIGAELAGGDKVNEG